MWNLLCGNHPMKNHLCDDMKEANRFQRFPWMLHHLFKVENNRVELCAKRSWPATTSVRGIWASTLGRCSTGSRRRCWPGWPGKNTGDWYNVLQRTSCLRDLETRKKGARQSECNQNSVAVGGLAAAPPKIHKPGNVFPIPNSFLNRTLETSPWVPVAKVISYNKWMCSCSRSLKWSKNGFADLHMKRSCQVQYVGTG